MYTLSVLKSQYIVFAVRDYGGEVEVVPGNVLLISQSVTLRCDYTGTVKWYFTKTTNLRNTAATFGDTYQSDVFKKTMDKDSAGFYICIGLKNGIPHIAKTFVDVFSKLAG